MKLIVFTSDPGEVQYLIPCSNELTLEELAAKDVPKNTDGSARSYVVIDPDQLPDHYFREAWTLDTNEVSVDVDKAKEIQRNHWRAKRKEKLAALDIEAIKAIEAGDTELLQSIAAQKQELRDVTLKRLPNKLDKIKDSWPSCLE